MTQQIKYKRVLLKLSGESLMGSDPFGINHDTIVQTVGEIAEVVKMGVQVGIVVGGGNIFRGVSAQAGSMDRATADYMGMMATVMNALALKDAFETLGIKARVQSALSMQQIAEPYARPKAIQYLEEDTISSNLSPFHRDSFSQLGIAGVSIPITAIFKPSRCKIV